jgi:hypothetical protein
LFERLVDLSARGDAELAENRAQVPLGGSSTDEQPNTDISVRMSVAGEPHDRRLRRGELAVRLRRAPGGAI